MKALEKDMTEDAPTASVVVCTYNRAAMLRGALESLFAQKMAPGASFEVIVVDDGSTDNTAEVAAGLARSSPVPVRCILGPHQGVAAARNAGVAAARGDWVAFLDDDERASPRWLAHLLRAAISEGADCVSGRNELSPDEPPPFELAATVRKLLGDNGFMAAPGATVTPGAGNALVRRQLFGRIGLFDPRLSYGEDADFFRRARRAGARIVFADAARIEHLVPKSRLEPAYLYAIADKGAASQASEDFKDGGSKALLGKCVLRLAHVALVALPRLAFSGLARNRGRLLGARCSARFGVAYCVAAGRRLASAKA
jgi:glycosyltransferase involved in cell wall biosynthesis